MRKLSFLPVLVLCAVAPGLLGACASSRATDDQAARRASVVGTWEYDVEGWAPLDQGRFQITVQEGSLQGLVRDRHLGRLRARVEVHDSRLELALDDLRISGYVKDGQFTGVLRRSQWDVTASRPRQPRSQFRSATLFAERVRSAAAADTPNVLECRSLLREADGCD